VLELVGLQDKGHRKPTELSGGEQQRVAIARAIVNQPGILLADEPTGNLDPTTSAGIMAILDKINQNGTTVVMATHDDDIVNSMRKRVIELRHGRVVRDEAKAQYTAMIPIVPMAGGTSMVEPVDANDAEPQTRRQRIVSAAALSTEAESEEAMPPRLERKREPLGEPAVGTASTDGGKDMNEDQK
jgi:cell division transport system ATP-binding protein